MPPFNPTNILKQEFPRGEAHSMDPEAFDEALRSQGVTLVHHRAMICPSGLISKDDNLRRIHVDHPGCSNGYLYKKQGQITALFTGNSASPNPQDVGSMDGSNATVTFPRTYDLSGTRIYVNPVDRFYLFEEDILWPHWEVIEHNISGVDRLHFPAVQVENLIDNRLEEYRQGVDFAVVDGQVKWLGQRRPGMDTETEGAKGRVYVVWYLYRPYWYVNRLEHEGRLIQTENEKGERKVVRMPFQVHLVREMVFESSAINKDANSPANERATPGARDGSFAPR